MRVRCPRTAAAYVLVLGLVACGTTPPSPLGSDATSPAPSDNPISGSGTAEALVVSILDDAGPYFALRVDAITPGGASRPIASYADIHPANWSEASPTSDPLVLLGPTGWLAVGVEKPGSVIAADEATLFFDLRVRGSAVREAVGAPFQAAFGPTGLLAIFDESLHTIDPATGQSNDVHVPQGVEPRVNWLADGSGFLADQYDGAGNPHLGGLSLSGGFTPGLPTVYAPTGFERPFGKDGGTLGVGVSDGPNGADTALVEPRAGLEPPGIVWFAFQEPGDNPHFGDFAWDAAGTGLWIVFSNVAGDQSWLSHVTEPKKDSRIVDLPGNAVWQLVGLSPDDHWIVLSSDDVGQLVLVDTVRREARVLAQSALAGSAAPFFVGWSVAP